MKITNTLNLPAPIVNAVKAQVYDRGDAQLSVTDLVNPPQITWLSRTFADQIVEDASQRIWMLLGTAIHNILEMAGDQATGEVRLFAGWPPDVKISGKFDHLVIEDNTLVDYKVTSAYAVKGEVKPEWEKQLNYYRWLCIENRINVDNLKIVAILRDWSKANMMRDDDYPRHSVVSIDVPVWDYKELHDNLGRDIEEHMIALEGNPRPCTDEERWHVPGKVALMKQGRKSAIKLFNTMSECSEYVMKSNPTKFPMLVDGGKHYIEERPTTYRRCEDYCAVSEFCDQWKEESN